MITYRKTLSVVTSIGTLCVQLNGVGDDERLTPKMARQALRIACGNDLGGAVSDGRTAYRVYAKSVRKLNIHKERTAELLDLYLAGRLPEDVTLVKVPIRLTAYGDYQVVNRHGQLTPPTDFEGQSETIRLEMHTMATSPIFAGYSTQLKTLVIGVEE